MLISPKILHIESTDACNAACPQCGRETDASFDKNNLHHLSIDQIKNLISEDTIRNLEKMFMCGNYGDPAAGKYTLEIYRYFREINPNIILGMNTNGGLRSIEWWKDLACILNQPKDYVVFSIDGLADTNHIYRINVNWNKVMDNAKAFVDAGGSAHWDMLVFAHNQHQVNLAEQTAKNLGFKWFRAKVSKRHSIIPINFLIPPKGWIDPVVSTGEIVCHAVQEQSIYVSAKGNMYPCCWLGYNTDWTLDRFAEIQNSWKEIPLKICKDNCTQTNHVTSFKNQWQYEKSLD